MGQQESHGIRHRKRRVGRNKDIGCGAVLLKMYPRTAGGQHGRNKLKGEILTRYKKILSFHEDSQVVEQVAERNCGVSILGGF